MHSLTGFQFFPGGEVTFFEQNSICFAKRIHFGLALMPWQHTRLHALCTHTYWPRQWTLSQRLIAVNPKPSKISTIYCSSLAKLICHTSCVCVGECVYFCICVHPKPGPICSLLVRTTCGQISYNCCTHSVSIWALIFGASLLLCFGFFLTSSAVDATRLPTLDSDSE